MKQVVYTRAAIRVLRRIPKNTADRIRTKILVYANDPGSLGNNVKALQGRTGIRLRVGEWRVIMEDGIVLEVIDVGPRGTIYD